MSTSADRGYPVKHGAVCACCMGPVDGFGCVACCEESERHRVDPYVQATAAEQRLTLIANLTRNTILAVRPEFLPDEIFTIHRLAVGAYPSAREARDV